MPILLLDQTLRKEKIVSEHKEASLVTSLLNLHSTIQKRIGAPLSVHGIGLSEYRVLAQLYDAPDQKMRRSHLAEQVGLSPSGVTRLLNPMQKIGLIVKEDSPRDARVSLVRLTAAGKTITRDADVSFKQASTALFESLDQKQLGTLAELLQTLE